MNPRKRRKKNILKLISFVFAFFLWLYVVSSSSVDVDRDVRVEYRLPAGFSISNDVPYSVKYKISGPRAIVDKLLKKDELILIDLKRRFRKGRSTYQFSYLNFSNKLPFSVKIRSAFPESIEVKLEPSYDKWLPIKKNLIGTLPNRLELESVKISPSKVKVFGAKSIVKKLKQIETEVIDLSTFSKNAKFVLSLRKPDKRLTLDKSEVESFVKVKSSLSEFKLQNIPIIIMSDKTILKRSHAKLDLIVLAPKDETMEKLKRGVRVTVRALGLKSGEHSKKVNIDLPVGASLVESSLQNVNITVGSADE